MDIKQCRFCRKNFQGFSNLCPKCVQEMDVKYLTLRNYLDEKPSSTMRELSEGTSVDEKSILFLVREGRLMLKTASADIKCIKCGAAIISGKYCDACRSGIMQTLNGARPDIQDGSGGGAASGRGGQPVAAKPQPVSVRGDDSKVELHTRSTRK